MGEERHHVRTLRPGAVDARTVVPFLFWLPRIFTFVPFVLGGACVWAVLMAMGLRQVWQAVQHHHRR